MTGNDLERPAAAGAAARHCVADLAHDEKRRAAWAALETMGPEALPAVREGLRHGHWQVRRWCAIWLDRNFDVEALPDLVPLLEDPKSKVRLFAVHSLSCEHCKSGENPIDIVPLLSERALHDESIRVRRMAVAMLAYREQPDPRVAVLCRSILEKESDHKLRHHARLGLMRCREAGVAP